MSECGHKLSAFDQLRVAIQSDSEYAWAWHCNIAMPLMDAGADPDTSNEGAARAMRAIFGVDTRTCAGWERRRRSTPVQIDAELARLRAIENAAMRVASNRRDGVVLDKSALDRLDQALEAQS